MSLDAHLCPANAAELLDLVAQAVASRTVLEVRGGGSKRHIGKPERGAVIVDLSAFTGVVDYEPSELVLTVRPATPLSEIETLLDANRQMLAFEPWDQGSLFGGTTAEATIGGVVAAGVAGSRRLSAGGVRDHLLGFRAVSGRAEEFKAGGKVVKNVTGYDLSKVIAGSWGQLAIMTELSLKVVPKPRCARTVIVEGLDPAAAIAVMAKAMGSRAVPAAAAHLPAHQGQAAKTLLRLEGFPESVEARTSQLSDLLGARSEVTQLGDAAGPWSDVREASGLAALETLWRVQLAPSRAAAFATALEEQNARWLFDWAGALLWIGAEASADIRELAGKHNGHAMLMRAPEAMLASTPIRQPELPAVAALSARVKNAFDPEGILDPYRFG